MFSIHITAVAEQDIQRNFDWWRENRSERQANRWYESIYPAIETLETLPRRCSNAREHEFYDGELRQLIFGVGNRVTHRILFTIEENMVIILKVLHVSQQDWAFEQND